MLPLCDWHNPDLVRTQEYGMAHHAITREDVAAAVLAYVDTMVPEHALSSDGR